MDTVRQWVLTVAVSAAAGAVVLMLSPEGSVNKSVKTAVSLFLTATMVMPFVRGFSFDVQDIVPDTGAGQPDLTASVEEQMRTALETELEKILSENGIKALEINIDMNISDNEITVKKIEIKAENGGNISEVRNRISRETGAEVVIEVSG